MACRYSASDIKQHGAITLTSMVEHINTAFPEETRPMMYKMMKWWGGKPHNVWSEYIKHYTNEHDIVLDPFCGRGVGVIEAIRNNRKAIGIDLNPIAIFQTKMIAKPLNVGKFKQEWNSIKQDLNRYEQQSGFFTTLCVKCKKGARLVTVNRNKGIPYTIFYLCPCTKGYLTKPLDAEDIDTITKSDTCEIETKYPKAEFPKAQSFDMARTSYGNTYDRLFSRRNIYALSIIFDRVNRVHDVGLRDFFRFAFISMVHLASSIPSVRENSSRVGSGSWGRPAYIMLKKRMELNPFVLYERAIESNQGILKGKTSSNERLSDQVKFCNTVNDLDSCNLLLLQKDTLELTSFLKENSVDYVITDPPYGGLIPYFSLSYIWSSWLSLVDDNFHMPFSDEITIDSRRGLDFAEYHRRMDIAFDHIYKVLKEGKYMTVTFHNDKPHIFNSMLRACQDSGFVLEKILFQMNKRAGETGAASPWGTSVSDFYIRFRKPKKDESKVKLTSFIEAKFANIVKRVAKEVISTRGEPTEIAAMIPHIYKDMGQSGMRIHFSSNEQISSILRRDESFVKKENGFWWLSDDVIKESSLEIPLSDRVEEAVLSALHQNYKVTYDNILQHIFEKFPNSLTPNTESVKGHLREYGEKTSDGMWKLKLGMRKDLIMSNHTNMESMLVKIGMKFGYDVWSPDKSKNSEMNRMCIDFNIDIPNADRIQLIDVLWIKNGEIKCAFEVENSTGITSALERGSHIDSRDVKKIIVLPAERTKFFRRKMQEPLFSDYFRKDKWSIIFYETLAAFAKGKRKNEDDFIKLLKKSA